MSGSDDDRGSGDLAVLGGIDADEMTSERRVIDALKLFDRLARIETREEETRRQIGELRVWVQGELQSAVNNINVTSGQLVRLDEAVRGANGNNGVMSRLSKLEDYRERKEKEDQRTDSRVWGVWMALIVAGISIALQFVGLS